MLIVLAASLVQIVRADRMCNQLAPPPPAGENVHEFTYAADDAYVHLDLARRMALTAPRSDAPWPTAAALEESPSPAWTAALAGIVRLCRRTPAADPGEHPPSNGSRRWC